MKQLLGRLLFVLALISGAANVHAQNDQVQDTRRQLSSENGRYDNNVRNPRQDDVSRPPDRRNAQSQGERQGRLTPEERQTLRRQIDEAGHDIYKRKR